MFQTARMLVLALQRCRAFFSSIKNPSNVIDPVVSKAKRSSRMAFLVAGITTAPWAALMPVVKQNTGIDESHFAILLLTFGGGGSFRHACSRATLKTCQFKNFSLDYYSSYLYLHDGDSLM